MIEFSTRTHKNVDVLVLFYPQFKANTILVQIQNAINQGTDIKEIQLHATLKRNNTELFIDDIKQMSPFNNYGMGYGQLAIKTIINYAKVLRVEKITGYLSNLDLDDSNDKDHKRRLLHFYKKIGFKITLFNDNTGNIEYTLKDSFIKRCRIRFNNIFV